MDNSYEIQGRLSKVTRYNRWLYDSFKDYLGSRILDAGCGYGNITGFLLDRAEIVVGLDSSPAFYEAVTQRFAGRPNFRCVLGDISDRDVVASLKPLGIDTVVCVNVLEHIRDDEGALDAFREILVRSGKLVVLVPAFNFLFGSMDRADGHFRRYSHADLIRKLNRCGFHIVMARYMNFLGIVGWFLNGKILRRTFIPESHYAAYDRLVPVLRAVEARIAMPLGLSLLCVAQK